jgi:hypothetical protein
MLSLLAEIYQQMPEKGFRTAWISDFTDEAFNFNEASKALDQIEMIVFDFSLKRNWNLLCNPKIQWMFSGTSTIIFKNTTRIESLPPKTDIKLTASITIHPIDYKTSEVLSLFRTRSLCYRRMKRNQPLWLLWCGPNEPNGCFIWKWNSRYQ